MRSEFEKFHETIIKSLTKVELKELTEKIKRLLVVNGILFRDREHPKLNYHVPVTLFPSPFPKTVYKELKSLQLDINTLIRKVSQDYDFLTKSLEKAAHEDEFTHKLLEIMKKFAVYPFPSKTQVGIIRSDYMVDDTRGVSNAELRAYLVEYNTISVSFGAQGSQIQAQHDSVLQHLWGMRNKIEMKIENEHNVNRVVEDLGLCLATAWSEYVKANNVSHTCIIFVVQHSERNVYDHVKIEKSAIKMIKSHISMSFGDDTPIPPIFYVTLQELTKTIKVNDSNGALMYRTDLNMETWYEVALVYFRSCYAPTDFKSDLCWKTRETLELNRAIKLPTVAQQLTGCKKIQQLLYSQNALKKYIPDAIAKPITNTFTGMYSLDDADPNLDHVLDQVKKNPANYVMKPQREGGGNNIYGKDIVNFADEYRSNNKSLNAYILMEMIQSTVYENYIVLPDLPDPVLTRCISELGIFGTYVSQDNSVLVNLSSGYIFRSKSVDELDGGVASGRAVLDSISLF